MGSENAIRIITLNVKGIKISRNKIPQIIKLIQNRTPDFLFLQETNINSDYLAGQILFELGLREGFFSLGSNCNGTAIIKTSDRWEITNKKADNLTGRVTTMEIKRGIKPELYTIFMGQL